MLVDRTRTAVRRIRSARGLPIEDRKFHAANAPAPPARSTDGIRRHVRRACRGKRKGFQPQTRPPQSSATAPIAGNFVQVSSLKSREGTTGFQRDFTVYMQSEFRLMRN